MEFVDDSEALLHLTRNHLYNVVIDEVKAAGRPTPWHAYVNKPSNIVVEITDWNDGGMSETLFKGQYSRTVDKSHLECYVEGIAKSMTVSTTYPDAWTVEDLPDWLEVVDIDPAAEVGVQSTLTLEVKSSDPLTTSSRSGEFYIVAGNLRKKITVTQSDEIEFWIVVTDPAGNPITELVFKAGDASNPPGPKSFRVTWLPSSRPLDVAIVPGTNPFDYGSGEDFSATPYAADSNGGYTFTVQPPRNAGTACATRLDFPVTLANGQSRMLPLYLRQEKAPAAYEFSPDGTTLTLFSNFDRGTNLALSSANIPELVNTTVAGAVTKLVVQGEPTFNQVKNISYNVVDEDKFTLEWVPGVLPNVTHVSLPDYTGIIASAAFRYYYYLVSLEAPRASGVESYGFESRVALTTVDLSAVKTIESRLFWYCSSLRNVKFPAAETINERAFSRCLNVISIDLPVARTIGPYAFEYITTMTLKLGYQGAISLDGNAFWGVTTSNVTLYLGTYEYNNANVAAKTWRGYTWKEILPY